jgi:beta-glucosidase
MFAFYPGAQGGNAIAGILFGDVNPSGKLPFTVPVSEAQLPPFDNVSRQVTYGFFHGYRYLDHDGDTPRFPFGHGISYTTFEYSNLRLSSTTLDPSGSVTITAEVTNSGSVAGDEIAELYVSANHSAVDRAVRDLKGFRRIHLEPRQTGTVSFTLRARDLAYYDVTQTSWTVEHTDYSVAIGASSRVLPLTATVTVR